MVFFGIRTPREHVLDWAGPCPKSLAANRIADPETGTPRTTLPRWGYSKDGLSVPISPKEHRMLNHLTAHQQHDLVRRWRQPHRRYHTLDHLDEVLAALDTLAQLGCEFDPTPVTLAAWFHNAVYDIDRTDNHEQSAALAATALGPGPLTDEVVRLVLATKDHSVSSADRNGAALIDADRAVLAGTPAQYQTYMTAIRNEFHFIASDLYRSSRIQTLRSILAAGPVYYSTAARTMWEFRARVNLQNELLLLGA